MRCKSIQSQQMYMHAATEWTSIGALLDNQAAETCGFAQTVKPRHRLGISLYVYHTADQL